MNKIKRVIMSFNNAVKNIFFILSLSHKCDKTYLCLTFSRIIISSVIPFIMIVFPKYIIDNLIEQKSLSNVLTIILVMLGSKLILTGIYIVIDAACNMKNEKINLYFNKLIGEKAMIIDFEDTENPEMLNKYKQARTILEQSVAKKITTQFANIISGIITMVGLYYILSTLHPIVITIIIMFVFVNGYMDSKQKAADYSFQIKTRVNRRKNDYVYDRMFDFSYGKEIRLFDLKDFMINKYNQSRNEFYEVRKMLAKPYIGVEGVYGITSCIQKIGIYIYMIYKFIKGRITIGDFTMYICAIEKFSSCFGQTISSLLSINQQTKYINDLKEFINYKSKLREKEDTKLKLQEKNEDNIIEFCDVWFKYPGQDTYTLKGISFKISNNERVSVVGENGSGKTTMIKLMMRLYNPTKGKILFNGVDISYYSYDDYIKMFSPVFQDYKIFSFSIKDNIDFIGSKENENKVRDSLRYVGLYEKISSFSENINTYMFKNFSKIGIELSGGEQQKLSIARALYKDAPIIVLDEPTAALSPMTEYEIYKNLNEMVKNKTTIYISHRLSSSRFSDRILVLDNGKIIELGNHKELIMKKGKYYQMFNAQAGFYTDVLKDKVV